MDVFVRSYGLKTQMLKVKPDYFRKSPVQSILHLKEKHYIVFLQDAGGYAGIFDPAYGRVYVPWSKLSKMMSGYMLYVYK
jgi:ABC-type bacteriocin/lantibiotic exporter with double-glycine peptidase domain